MRRRVPKSFQYSSENSFVQSVLREVKKELMKDQMLGERIHKKQTIEKGHNLLSGLLEFEAPKKASPIYH